MILESGSAPAIRSRKRGDWISRISTVLVCVFVVELLFGGPGFWSIAGISIRRALVAVLAAWFLSLWIAGRLRPSVGHVLSLVLTAIFLLAWMVVLPSLYDASQLANAVQEALPIALLFPAVLMHAYFRARPLAWLAVTRVAGSCLTAVAIATIVLWLISTIWSLDPVAVALAAKAYFTLGNLDLEPSLFIHRMPDGFFRIMWITSVLFVPGLLYALARRSIAGVLVFSTGLFVSYTRALWLAALIGIVIAVVASPRRDPFLKVPARHLLLVVAVALTAVLFDALGDAEESALSAAGRRLGATFSDESAEERFGQLQPLLDAWQARPLFGSGFGSAAANSSRSDTAPYLYELTYVALLMKVGVIGLLCLAAGMFVLLIQPRRGDRYKACALGAIGSFLIATGTNPYLINLVGMSLLSFLLIDLDQSNPAKTHREAVRPKAGSA